MSEEMINKKDVPLFVDVYCYKCGRRIAFSNAIQIDGRTYCPKCGGVKDA